MYDLSRGAGAFPPTRLTVVSALAQGNDRERHAAFGALAALYWKAVYKYARLKWHAAPDEAEDLTQGFFARALEKEFFAAYDPGRARFRTFLRTCLDGFIANTRAAGSRLK